jgi:hypothetical protein
MPSYLILGAGKFGRLALRRLGAREGSARFLLIDRRPEALAAAGTAGVEGAEMLEGDAISFLGANLGPGSPWDWLIPMVPVHVAYAWLLAGPLAGQGWETAGVPEDLADLTVFAVKGPQGELYLSQARHLCPDDCAEPDVCPVTEKARPQTLYDQLAGTSRPERPVHVVASTQLAPGVGGYPPRELLKLAKDIAESPGPLLVATACRCHGVVHGLKRKGETSAKIM